MTEAESRAYTIRQANLDVLTKHPAWPDLAAEVDRHTHELERRLIARALHGDPNDTVSPEDQAYTNGFMAGMRWFLSFPAGAEGRLERHKKKRGLITEEEEADAA